MTSLYNGWTPPVKSSRDLAIDRLNRVAEQMTDEEYQIWFDDAIRAHMPMTIEEIGYTAEAWLQGDDCNHCEDSACKCQAHEEIIF